MIRQEQDTINRVAKDYTDFSMSVANDIYNCNKTCTANYAQDIFRMDPISWAMRCQCDLPVKIDGRRIDGKQYVYD